MWTLQVEIELSDGSRGLASVPQGKSTGSFEAVSISPLQSLRQIERVLKEGIIGISSSDQQKFDGILQSLDGTNDKSYLGANTLLAISYANAKAQANSQHVPLWKYLADQYDTTPRLPGVLANVINGGLHAGNSLPFQEYLILPQVTHSEYAVHMIVQFYQTLGKHLKDKWGGLANAIGDEGGYAPPIEDPLEPFEIFNQVRDELNLSPDQISYGLDAAANEVAYSEDELFDLYDQIKEKYQLRYLEDPFGESNGPAFSKLLNATDRACPIVGDDLTATDIKRIHAAFTDHTANGVIIKPNQIGTVSEAMLAGKRAQEYGWYVVASHRSGETNDTAIVDLGVALGADALKIGAPARGERVAKYNRLLVVADELRVAGGE